VIHLRYAHDTRATGIYQRIFGADVVAYAHVPKDQFGEIEKDGTLPTPGSVLLILRNGRKVEISTSEWGGAWTPKDEDLIEIAA
jgi:hypothetical protein